MSNYVCPVKYNPNRNLLYKDKFTSISEYEYSVNIYIYIYIYI